MKTLKLRLMTIGAMVLIATVTVFVSSCQKDSEEVTPAVSGANPTTGALLMARFTNCHPARGRMCDAGGFGCLVMFPSDGTGIQDITFYAPVTNGEGSTGTQLKVEFNNHFPGLDQGILGPEQEGDDPYLPMAATTAQMLGCQSIEVVNKVYYPIYDNEHPNGYVLLDCIAQQQ